MILFYGVDNREIALKKLPQLAGFSVISGALQCGPARQSEPRFESVINYKKIKKISRCSVILFYGVDNRTRTCDNQIHNLALYQLNYIHHMAGVDRFELSHARVKVLCLTAWRYPIVPKLRLLKAWLNSAFRTLLFAGASRGIRTPDPRLRRAMLYPAELLTHLERVKGIEPS